MNNSQPYIPINCSFYDYLEEAATLGNVAVIEYMKEGSVESVEDKIQTLFIENKVEYMMLEKGRTIRLDNLISFNGKLLANSC
jgi:Rho-binding antiterminator